MEVKKERKTSAWAIALKKWNSNRSCYSIPKKNSDEWKAVRALMGEAPKEAPKATPKEVPKEAPKEAQEPKEKIKKVTVKSEKSEGRPAPIITPASCATVISVPTAVPKSKPKGVVKEQKLVLLTA
jgi:hypothetical protein